MDLEAKIGLGILALGTVGIAAHTYTRAQSAAQQPAAVVQHEQTRHTAADYIIGFTILASTLTAAGVAAVGRDRAAAYCLYPSKALADSETQR